MSRQTYNTSEWENKNNYPENMRGFQGKQVKQAYQWMACDRTHAGIYLGMLLLHVQKFI